MSATAVTDDQSPAVPEGYIKDAETGELREMTERERT